MTTLHSRIIGASLLAAIVSVAVQSLASAGSLTASMPVSVTIGGATGACSSLTASAMAFGNVSSTGSGSATSTVTINCTAGTAYSLTAEGTNPACAPGTGPGYFFPPATGSNTNYPVYLLYKDSGHTQVLNSNTDFGCAGGTAITGTGTGGSQATTIYGLVSGSGNGSPSPAGTYTDTATVKITF